MLDNMPFSLAGAPEGGVAATAFAPRPAPPYRAALRAWVGDMVHFIVRQRDIRVAVAALEASDERFTTRTPAPVR